MNWEVFTNRWLQRAERAQVFVDDGDRFISLWIAFNGWMRSKFGEDIGDRCQIESVKRMRDFEEVFDKLKKEAPAFREYLEELDNIPVVNMQFKNNREDIYRYDGSFESLIEVLYQVRCNLFHGRKNINEDKKDIKLVSLAYRILLPLFKTHSSI